MIPKSFLNAIAHEHYLSRSEEEALVLAMKGKSTAAIAEELGISGDAVRKRLSEVYQKFQISGRGPVKLTKLQQQVMARYQQEQGAAELPNEPNGQGREGAIAAQPSEAQVTPDVELDSPPRHYWGEAPDGTIFYGREAELAQLQQWIIQDRCRLVALLGMAGIGKTSLAVKLARQLQGEVDVVIWLSLRQAPRLPDLLSQVARALEDPKQISHNGKFQDVESQLLQYFHAHRCLLILDGAESLLQGGRLTGVYRDGYEAYGKLLQRVGQEPHQSCVLVTSQEKPSEISRLEGESSPVRSLTLKGLDAAEAELLLREKSLTGNARTWGDLVRGYRGNPFMLQMVATTIRDVFDGNVTAFLKTTLFTHDISDYIETILERVSDIEDEILQQLALTQEPMAMTDLLEVLPESSPQDLIQALQSLKQRSLLETSEGRFSLPPAVLEVVAP